MSQCFIYFSPVGQDGGLRIFPSIGPFHRPSAEFDKAHAMNSETSCVRFANDNISLISRGADDTLKRKPDTILLLFVLVFSFVFIHCVWSSFLSGKVWDIRQLKLPVHVAKDLANFHTETGCDFSPDDTLIVTGTSVRRNEGQGKLVFFDKTSFKKVYEQGKHK